jgi:hypothetical protein
MGTRLCSMCAGRGVGGSLGRLEEGRCRTARVVSFSGSCSPCAAFVAVQCAVAKYSVSRIKRGLWRVTQLHDFGEKATILEDGRTYARISPLIDVRYFGYPNESGGG